MLISAGAIGLFCGAGLTWGRHTHLSMAESWRWWVVHLWVEGFFEVFATTVIAFFFARLNLIRPGVAAKAALLWATIFLSGGSIGTCHHLYFSRTPTVALAWGSVFSALEVVPLTQVAHGAIDDLRRATSTTGCQGYWYARSREFLGTPLMQTLRWLRVPGDTVFALGALARVGSVFTIRTRKISA